MTPAEARIDFAKLESRRILGVRVDATSYSDATHGILEWASQRRSCYVCLGTVNHIMEARESPQFRAVMERADLVTADGMPLVWLLRRLGIPRAPRVYGPDLMIALLGAAAAAGVPVGFYGGSDAVLERLLERAEQRWPHLNIAFAEAPPFRPPTFDEDQRTVREINQSGARILFVGLGTPKQDRWMYEHRGRLQAVMLGVGAAFDFFTGAKPQAPRWMQRRGLEWLFRLAAEPGRLSRRYLRQNPRFAILAIAQLLRTRLT